jgi:hypothetical protein
VSGATLAASQTVGATWSSPLSVTASFQDAWSISGVIQATTLNGNLNFGLGAPQGYAGVTFTFTLATAGSYDINWTALKGGAGAFGQLNMAAKVDNAPLIYAPGQLTATLNPTGDFAGALAAGTHTISLYDVSNITGLLSNFAGTLTETLGMTISPLAGTPTGVNGIALGSMTFINNVGGTGGQTLTGQASGLTAFSGTLAAFNGDIFTNLTANDIIDIKDMAFSGIGMAVTSSGGNTIVTLTENATPAGGPITTNGQTTTFTVVGTFSQTSFHLASDGAQGVLLAHA